MSWSNPLNGRLPAQNLHELRRPPAQFPKEEDKSPIRIPSIPSYVESDDDAEEVNNVTPTPAPEV